MLLSALRTLWFLLSLGKKALHVTSDRWALIIHKHWYVFNIEFKMHEGQERSCFHSTTLLDKYLLELVYTGFKTAFDAKVPLEVD